MASNVNSQQTSHVPPLRAAHGTSTMRNMDRITALYRDWSSWNFNFTWLLLRDEFNPFVTLRSESLVKSMADTLNNSGYVVAGFRYLAVGDCWQAKSRDSQGRLQPDKDRFPSGIKSTADYVRMGESLPGECEMTRLNIIEIDIPNNKLNVKLSDDEIRKRLAELPEFEPKIKSGYLARYATMVSSADKGAVFPR